jgi:hypothetical protein
MRRTTLIFGLFLTLTAGVWGSALAAVADACCMNETHAHDATTSPAPDEHDCCRAKLYESNAPSSDSTKHSHHAAKTHEDAPSPQPQAVNSHAQMDCVGGEAPEREAKATKVAAFVERGRSCLECCAGRTGQVPAKSTVSAPEPNRVKRAAAHVSVARDSFAPGTQGVSHLTPSQHAPPAPRERRHILIGIFLI